jgi:uncharacterized protein (TIGR00296 family)
MDARREWGYLCFEALLNYLTHSSQKMIQNLVSPSLREPRVRSGVIVGWEIHGQQRGLVGCFNRRQTFVALQQYAVLAATQDGRYDSIKINELSDLVCHVSIVHSMEPARNPFDWEIGVHGLRVLIDGKLGTCLPETIVDHHWKKEQALANTVYTAGYWGEYDRLAILRTGVERFRTTKFVIPYAEYESIRSIIR